MWLEDQPFSSAGDLSDHLPELLVASDIPELQLRTTTSSCYGRRPQQPATAR
jgi:hypothetical protein